MTTVLSPITELPEAFRPLLREEYDRLIEIGVFHEGMRIELVGGVLVDVSPQGQPHKNIVMHLTMMLAAHVAGRHSVSVQGPVDVDEVSEPEPDLAVFPRPRYAPEERQEPPLLVVEVARSSLRFDLGEKARRYAAAGFPEYWVIDVESTTLHRHTGPHADGTWQTVEPLTDGAFECVAIDGFTLDVGDLFSDRV